MLSERFARRLENLPIHPKMKNLPNNNCDATSPARLSVVVVARGRLSSIQKTLECLLAQTAAGRVELILSTDSPALLAEAEKFVSARPRFAQARFRLDAQKDIALARVSGAAEASGDSVAFAEDHCFYDPNWAQEVLAAFDSSEAVMGAAPLMLNPNRESAVSRAQFLLSHGLFEVGLGEGRFASCEQLPWHSAAYRRGPFIAESRDEGSFHAESFMQRNVLRRHPGSRFVRCTQSISRHVNMSRLLPALGLAYYGGRVFGAERAKRQRWGWPARSARFFAFPLVALLKLARRTPHLWDGASPSQTLATFLAAGPIALCHALGEAWGICFGRRGTSEKHAAFECDRSRFLRPAEWHHLLPDAAWAQENPASGASRPEKVIPCL